MTLSQIIGIGLLVFIVIALALMYLDAAIVSVNADYEDGVMTASQMAQKSKFARDMRKLEEKRTR